MKLAVVVSALLMLAQSGGGPGVGGGQTRASTSAWTTDTLYAHLTDVIANNDRRYEQRFVAQEKAVATALSNVKEANEKTSVDFQKRFESVNEFRGQLKDQAATLLPRTEAEARFTSLEARIARNEKDLAEANARGVGKDSITGPLWGLGGAVLVGVLLFILNRRQAVAK